MDNKSDDPLLIMKTTNKSNRQYYDKKNEEYHIRSHINDRINDGSD